jgi:hydroxyacylglutathione hydrolase
MRRLRATRVERRRQDHAYPGADSVFGVELGNPECREGNILQKITVISLRLPYRLGSVNCYLIETDAGYVLVDTGSSNRRNDLEKELESAGCKPGNLRLIVLTHGDFDHTGNAAYLRSKYGTKIAMHYNDSGMVEQGNMFFNRKRPIFLLRMIVPIFFGFGKSKRFVPDLYIDDGHKLAEYGLEAEVISIPGHSKGSIGILTVGGDFFCGDLLENTKKPALNSLIDQSGAANASIEKLKTLEMSTVYPGHGKPFPMDILRNNLTNQV